MILNTKIGEDLAEKMSSNIKWLRILVVVALIITRIA